MNRLVKISSIAGLIACVFIIVLSTNNESEAQNLSYKLHKLNEERKILENNFLVDIYKIAEKNKESSGGEKNQELDKSSIKTDPKI